MSMQPPANLPASLAGRSEQVLARLAEVEQALDLVPAAAETAPAIALVSDFVLRTLERAPEALVERLGEPGPLRVEPLEERLALGRGSEREAAARLRRMRNIEMARIAWRDLAGWSTLEETFHDLTLLADQCVRSAVAYAERSLAERHPGASRLPPLLVLAMGKLGGAELNFSSDIDLVLLRPELRDGPPEGAAETYYLRLAQLVIRLLDQKTEDGFVFRVDTRLRPFGGSGPLVIGLGAFESYLTRHGRDWERYAYIKARLLTGREFEHELFDEMLTPFVYRRYLDYGVFDALRQMKGLIAKEVARRDLADNLKLGPGGIREIEFIVQAVQLARGGRERALRSPVLLEVLPRLVETHDLTPEAVAELLDSYRFLRQVENRLQAIDDQQQHALPEEPQLGARLAFALGAPDYPALAARVAAVRSRVEARFSRLTWERGGSEPEAEPRRLLESAWQSGHFEDAVDAFPPSERSALAAELENLRQGGLYARMDEPSRQRLAAAISRTVPLLVGEEHPSRTLARVAKVYAAIGRRSAYLALLNENPEALERLLGLAAHSEFIVDQIAAHPLLLDELLDARLFDAPPSRAEFAAMLSRYRAEAGGDTEAELEGMRQFQRAATFRVAVADRLGGLELMKVSDRLTDIAELVLALALELAWAELTGRFGRPRCGDPPELREAGFAIIGYGKLGGLELGYGSDLDLVFLHDSAGAHQETDAATPLDNARFYARLAQRLIHFLSIQTRAGRLYEIDTRLRPSGRSGSMVASFESFRRYQRETAWVWEHQALLRSRSVAGSETVRSLFENERREVLIHHVKRDGLGTEIATMRARMRRELSVAGPGEFDLKQDIGGLADIEFIVDYLVLRHAPEYPELVVYPDNVRQLEALERTGLVPAPVCRRLVGSYLALRERSHELALDGGGRVVPEREFAELRREVTALWQDIFGDEAAAL